MAKILIVEDEKDIRHALKLILERGKHYVRLASTVGVALRLLNTEIFDAVLCDLRLSNSYSSTDGLEVVQYARQVNPETYIEIITGYDILSDVGIQAGADKVSIKGSRSFFKDLPYQLNEQIREKQLYCKMLKMEEVQLDKQIITPLNAQIIQVTNQVSLSLIRHFEAHPEDLMTMDRRLFEELIAELWSGFGYEVELTKRTRDGGKDIIAIGGGIVGTKFLIECKRPDPGNKINVLPVRALLGVKTNDRATKGILATTAYFTPAAIEFIQDNRWELEGRDFDGIVEWIRKYIGLKSPKPF